MKLSDENKSKYIFEEKAPFMVLTIDVGSDKLELLNIYDINNPEQDIYNFCLKNNLDFSILKEIKEQIQILISQNIQQNNKQNQINSISKEGSQLTEINGYDYNIKYQNFINSSDNLTETNFNTNQQNNIEDINNLELFDGNKNNIMAKSTNNNKLKKYYCKLPNYTTNTNNIKDTKKIIRHKIHKSKIEEMDKEMQFFDNKNNNNLSSQIFNNYTPSNSSFFISPSFNTNNHNPNFALRNYFSKEEDIYFTENNPYSEYNNIIKDKNKRNKNKKVNKSMSVNGIYLKKINPGQDLYERNLKYNEEKKEKIKILKKNLESDQDEDNTFSPKINKISKIQKEHRKQKKLEYSNPDIIKNYKKYKDDRIKMLKKKQEKEYEIKYSFKPIINNSSSTFKNISIQNKINKFGSKTDIKNNDSYNKESKNEENKNITRFEKLYNERIHQKDIQNKLRNKIYNEFSFKPKINENSAYLKLDKPFKERLKTYSNKTKENMKKIKIIYEKEKGLDKSFKPKINTEKNKNDLFLRGIA